MAFGDGLARRADWMLGVGGTRELDMGGSRKRRLEEMKEA